MTKEDLLETLKQGIKDKKIVRGKDNLFIRFEFTDDPLITIGDSKYRYECCPLITACQLKTGKRFWNTDWRRAANKLELELDVAIDFVNASDGDNEFLNSELRKELEGIK